MSLPRQRESEMRTCKTCTLTEKFPSARFNAEGRCNYCLAHEAEDRRDDNASEYRIKFEKLISIHAGKGQYDVLAAFSGGKDSTYTLDLFRNHFRLKVLALTFDHGFVSPYAVGNIRTVTEALGVDHIMFRPDFHLVRDIFRASAARHFYAKKAIERSSTICLSCMNLARLIMIKTAQEKKIPFIGFGWSPGQAPVQSSVMKNSPYIINAMQRSLARLIDGSSAREIPAYMNGPGQNSGSMPINVHPLAFMEYDERKIYDRIAGLGWQKPADTDANSTNCLMNAFANRVHIEQYGFHPYDFEISGLIRAGVMTRAEGLERLTRPENEEIIRHVKKRLGLTS